MSWEPASSESSVSSVLEGDLKSVARDDKTGRDAMSEIHETAKGRSFAAQQARIGIRYACAEHLNVMLVTHYSAFQLR